MKSVEQRRKEQRSKRDIERQQRRRAKAPVTEVVRIGQFDVTIPLSQVFAPILEKAEDTRLLDIALKYDLPLTEEQAFLVQEGDTFLPQYEKIELSEEEQIELMMNDWSPLQSSNIAAVKIDGNDLLILFHSGDTYRYPDKANMYFPFNEALSPGRLLHRTIRFARGYRKEA
jgi:hypothetical protein